MCMTLFLEKCCCYFMHRSAIYILTEALPENLMNEYIILNQQGTK